jgi:hypothetical protein
VVANDIVWDQREKETEAVGQSNDENSAKNGRQRQELRSYLGIHHNLSLLIPVYIIIMSTRINWFQCE